MWDHGLGLAYRASARSFLMTHQSSKADLFPSPFSSPPACSRPRKQAANQPQARPPQMPQAAGPGARAAGTPKPNGLAHRLTKNNICYNG